MRCLWTHYVANGQMFKEMEKEVGRCCTDMIQSEGFDILNSYLFLMITKTKESKNNMFICIWSFVLFTFTYFLFISLGFSLYSKASVTLSKRMNPFNLLVHISSFFTSLLLVSKVPNTGDVRTLSRTLQKA